MYTKKQKIEIYINFFLVTFAIEIFHILIARKGLLEIYTAGAVFPWTLPYHYLLPIWTAIYICIAISGAMVYIKRASHIRSFALTAWIIQLLLNITWPVCFFFVPIPILPPIILSLLFMAMIISTFYAFLLDWKIMVYYLLFFFMIVYQMIFHWIFYILNSSLA